MDALCGASNSKNWNQEIHFRFFSKFFAFLLLFCGFHSLFDLINFKTTHQRFLVKM